MDSNHASTSSWPRSFRGAGLAGLLLLAAPGSAFNSSLGPAGLGARSAGQAGAVAADDDGLESLFWNPAALAGLQKSEIAVIAGPGGSLHPSGSALAVALPSQDWGNWGLSLM